MARDSKAITQSEKAAFERAADALATETLQMVCREKVFPKRTRWVMGGKIADLVNDYHSTVITANGIKVTTREEFIERHRMQTLAIAYLYALNVKMGLAQVVLSIDPNGMNHWATLWNNADRCTKAWMNKDTARYSLRFGALSPAFDEVPSECSPNPSNANNERNVNPSGALNNNNANNTNGVVPDRENVSDKLALISAESKALTQGEDISTR